MNFTSFGGPFPGTIPGVHQFTSSGTLVSSPVTSVPEATTRYQNTTGNMTHFNQPITTTVVTSTMPAKFRVDETTSATATTNSIVETKYNGHLLSNGHQQQYTTNVPYSQHSEDKRLVAATITYPQSNSVATTSAGHIQQSQQQTQEISQDLCSAILQQQSTDTKRVLQNSTWQSLNPGSAVADYLSHLPANSLPLSLQHFLKYSAENIKKEAQTAVQVTQALGLNTLGTGLTLTQNQQNQIPQQQQQQQQSQQQQHQQHQQQQHQHQQHHQQQSHGQSQSHQQHHQTQQQLQQQQQHQHQQQTQIVQQSSEGQSSIQQQIRANNILSSNTSLIVSTNSNPTVKKKKRKKAPKEKKPKPSPGEIRITTALDGSPLYCCPECQMCYPERGLLEVHLVGHNLERRFICDICNAALKRKDHLTRHKQSHNPERPFICSVCLKAFKRKEQLSLHFVIHSGEKRHICSECGKGFYRKDHLRKHTRSHIARRVKAELSLQNQNGPSILLPQPQSPQIQQQMQQHQLQQQQQQQQQQQTNQHIAQTQQQHQVHQQQIQQHHTQQQIQGQQHSQQNQLMA